MIEYINLTNILNVKPSRNIAFKYMVAVLGYGQEIEIPFVSQDYVLEFSKSLQQAVDSVKSQKSEMDSTRSSAASRLQQLQKLFNEGLIDQREFDQKRKEIIRAL